MDSSSKNKYMLELCLSKLDYTRFNSKRIRSTVYNLHIHVSLRSSFPTFRGRDCQRTGRKQ
jgi:hypothetical protein